MERKIIIAFKKIIIITIKDTVVPVAVVAFGALLRDLEKHLRKMEFNKINSVECVHMTPDGHIGGVKQRNSGHVGGVKYFFGN